MCLCVSNMSVIFDIFVHEEGSGINFLRRRLLYDFLAKPKEARKSEFDPFAAMIKRSLIFFFSQTFSLIHFVRIQIKQ